jgi:tetratricopeptide (TPR) repeat protein
LPKVAYGKARETANKALELDSSLSEAHTALAWVKLYSDWDMEGAEAAFIKAIELNPNSASAYRSYSSFLDVTVQREECHESSKQALRLDPNNNDVHTWYGLTYHRIGHSDSAIMYLKERIKLVPNSLSAHYYLGYIYLETGNYDLAIKELETAVELFSGPQPYHLYLGMAYARNGMLDKTRVQLKIMDEFEKQDQIVSFGKAILFAELEEVEQALYWLEKSYQERNQYLLYMKTVPMMFASIRSDPRFMEIYNKVWPNDK